MIFEPVSDLDGLVRRAAVHDQVQFPVWMGLIDLTQKRQEFLAPVPGFHGFSDLADRDF